MDEAIPFGNIEPSLWTLGELVSALSCLSLSVLYPFVARYFPAFAAKLGHPARGYADADADGGPAGRGPSMFDSGLGRADGRRRTGSKADGSAPVEASVSGNGSEVELTQTGANGLGGSLSEVHVMRELSVDVERASRVGPGEFGVTGYIAPVALGKTTGRRGL